MKTVAVLGATSMVGREVIRQLRDDDVSVLTIGRAKSHDIVYDLAGPLAPLSTRGEADVIFHCAAHFGGDDINANYRNFVVNSLGCLGLLSVASLLNCRHIVYTGTVSSSPDFETTRQISSYGLSKAHGEELLAWGMTKVGGTFCSLRLPQIVDTEGRCCRHQPWFGRIIAYASRGLNLKLPASAGERNLIHVRDAARMLIAAAHAGLVGRWPLCNPERLTYTEIAELAYSEFSRGGCALIDSGKIPFREVYFPDSLALFRRLGIKPRISISAGIAEINRQGFSDNFGPLDVT